MLGWLEHNRVPGSQCWGQFPGGHQQREIPRNDLSADANRLAERVVEKVIVDWNRVALDFPGQASEILKIFNGLRNINIGRFPQGFAIVERFKLGQFFGAVSDNLCGFIEDFPALMRSHPGPGATFKRPTRSGDSQVDIFCFTFSHVGQHFTS